MELTEAAELQEFLAAKHRSQAVHLRKAQERSLQEEQHNEDAFARQVQYFLSNPPTDTVKLALKARLSEEILLAEQSMRDKWDSRSPATKAAYDGYVVGLRLALCMVCDMRYAEEKPLARIMHLAENSAFPYDPYVVNEVSNIEASTDK